jgi:hypothetical protein
VPSFANTNVVTVGSNMPRTAATTLLTAGIVVAFCTGADYELINGPAGWTIADRDRIRGPGTSEPLGTSAHHVSFGAGAVAAANYAATDVPEWVTTTIAVNSLLANPDQAVVLMTPVPAFATTPGAALRTPPDDRAFGEPVAEPPDPEPITTPGRPWTTEPGEPHR